MKHMPTLAEVMTAFPVHVTEDVSLITAVALMSEHGCHHLPVMDEHRVVGILGAEEIKLAQSPGHGLDNAAGLTAGDLCQRRFAQVDLHTRLDVVLQGMAQDGRNAVIVLKQDRLAGILTSQDACRYFALWLRKEFLGDDDPGVA
ncbi:MAG: CBS domain-containing protein [Oceanospirillaceae bacterium]|nr:CBS domain-containing protein [Oceanospirillaceae bacterium]